jgi:hypothetical protein
MNIGLPNLGVGSRSGTAAAPTPPPELPTENLYEHWQLNTGITEAGGVVSAWEGQIGGNILAIPVDSFGPTLQGDGSILFDGTSQGLERAPFVVAQPFTVYLLGKQVSWGTDGYIWAADGASVYQDSSSGSPAVSMYASGGLFITNLDWAVGVNAPLCTVFNGASSVIQVGAGTPVTGELDVEGLYTFQLGAQNGVGAWTNIQVKEILIYDVAHDATQRAAVRAYLNSI